MTVTELPSFLRNPEAFSEHLSDQFADQENTQKGDAFLAFTCKVLPLCEFWRDFGDPEPSEKKTHDRGIDFAAHRRSGVGQIFGQAKFKIREVGAFDSVISKFAAYDNSLPATEGGLAGAEAGQQGVLPLPAAHTGVAHYVIVTTSDLAVIRKRYEDSQLPSRSFYSELVAKNRLHVLDGVPLLSALQSLYRQSYLIAPQLELELASPALHLGNVYISVVSGKTLRILHERYGTSLFFENIRDFLGPSENGDDKEVGVNEAIRQTLDTHPDKMLGRNNGITFRADGVDELAPTRVLLRGGSIVNGCQTTMCVVNAGEEADCAFVAVKIVVADDSWEVAKSANYQNRVTRIDLEIARFLRPQLVRKIATDLGYGGPQGNDQSIATVLDDIHLTKVSYDAIKWLYLGLFSRHPNNLFDGIYSEVRTDALSLISAQGKHEYVMRVLFQLWDRCNKSAASLRDRYKTHQGERFLDVFKRFFDSAHLKYQCLLAILTACGSVNDDLMDKKPNADEAARRLLDFIGRLDTVLLHHSDYFEKVFRHAFGVITEQLLQQSRGDLSDLMQKMFNQVTTMSGSAFGKLCMSLRGRMINDDALASAMPSFE